MLQYSITIAFFVGYLKMFVSLLTNVEFPHKAPQHVIGLDSKRVKQLDEIL